MREGATLKLDGGEKLRFDIDRDELDRDEIVVRRSGADAPALAHRLGVLDNIIATAAPHPTGTTDRLLAEDRER